MGKLTGKVALVTGAGRGQGRAQAVKLAEEGADIIALDICADIATVPYSLATAADLDETVKLVEEHDRRVLARQADVRDRAQVAAVVDEGVAEFGHIDIACANAGIWSYSPFTEMSDETYHDMINVLQHGPYHVCRAVVPHLLRQGTGGSIIITSSTAGLRGYPNLAHYTMGKHAVVGLMRSLANELGPQNIRVNTVHPSSVKTDMIMNQAIWDLFAPGVENPTAADCGDAFQEMNCLPIPWMDPADIANAVAWLASDDSRYVTGTTLVVDAGYLAKM
jgi:SDR family mycofactocin-dependent oxidoreductase